MNKSPENDVTSDDSDRERKQLKVRFQKLLNDHSDSDQSEVGDENNVVQGEKSQQDVFLKNDMVMPGKVVNLVSTTPQNLLVVQVKINDKYVTALLDTGADRSLISSRIVDELNLNVKNSADTFDVLGQSTVGCMGNVSVDVNIEGFGISNQKFVVFSSEINTNISILLGVDYMKKNNLEINVKNRLLIKHVKHGGYIEYYLDSGGCVTNNMVCSVPCFADGDVQLLENQVHRVKISIPSLPQTCDMLVYEDNVLEKSLNDRVHGLSGISDANSKYIYMLATDGKVNVKNGDQVGVVNAVLNVDGGDEEGVVAAGNWEDQVDLSRMNIEKKGQLFKLLNNYNKVFSLSDADIGLASVTSHKIRVTDETPIYQGPRRFPRPIAEELERQCRELCDADIIEPSASSSKKRRDHQDVH